MAVCSSLIWVMQAILSMCRRIRSQMDDWSLKHDCAKSARQPAACAPRVIETSHLAVEAVDVNVKYHALLHRLTARQVNRHLRQTLSLWPILLWQSCLLFSNSLHAALCNLVRCHAWGKPL